MQKSIKTFHNVGSSLIKSFQQQKIKGWYFVPSFYCTFIINLFVATFLIVCGSVHLSMIADLKEVCLWCFKYNKYIVKKRSDWNMAIYAIMRVFAL